jgi:hypothetical protein
VSQKEKNERKKTKEKRERKKRAKHRKKTSEAQKKTSEAQKEKRERKKTNTKGDQLLVFLCTALFFSLAATRSEKGDDTDE